MDERLNQAVATLCAAAGELAYMAQLNPDPVPGPKSPPDLSKDVLIALSKYVFSFPPLMIHYHPVIDPARPVFQDDASGRPTARHPEAPLKVHKRRCPDPRSATAKIPPIARAYCQTLHRG
jgi:hypothetical protein